MHIADTSEVIVKAQFADTVVAKLKVRRQRRRCCRAICPASGWAGASRSSAVRAIRSTARSKSGSTWATPPDACATGSAAEVVVATNSVKRRARRSRFSRHARRDERRHRHGDDRLTTQSVAHETKVKVGIRTPDTIQILEGLQAGDTVVIEGNYALPDGTKVEVNNTAAEQADRGRSET
ncbi:MAG: hypothetical protein WKF84_00700 [Pyrinomonadaceae bacterium]